MDKKEYYTVESYALFVNTDNSILKLNDAINKFGYQFIKVNLEELEKDFSDLFHLPKTIKSEISVQIEDSGLKISQEFFRLITNNELDNNILVNKEVVLLKRIQDYDQEIVDNTIQHTKTFIVSAEFRLFVESLIQQLRLYKTGNIDCSTQFQISKIERAVTLRLSGKFAKPQVLNNFSITDVDSIILKESLLKEFKSNPLTELALNNFNLSYEVVDDKIKYILLMTCLESLFNLGKDQIAHTISRHLSAIISKNKIEFDNNYIRIKKLYKIRNDIVHGSILKENLINSTAQLQSLVRTAINYCIKLQITKKDLFDKLNSLGFSD